MCDHRTTRARSTFFLYIGASPNLKKGGRIKGEHMKNRIRRKKHHDFLQLKSRRQFKGIIQWIRFWVISARE
jgi:hypothetical protein